MGWYVCYYGVVILRKYRKIKAFRIRCRTTCYTYYVYQSTPFDLMGTPDFDSISFE